MVTYITTSLVAYKSHRSRIWSDYGFMEKREY
jgi:hypothetical protein